MSKRILEIDEATELLRDELEGVIGAVECPEHAAYWLTRLTGAKAEAKADILVVELTPERVELLLRGYYDKHVDMEKPDEVADELELICPATVEVLIDDETGDWTGVSVADYEVDYGVLEECLDDCE